MKEYTFKNGVTVQLRKIGRFMLSRLMVDRTDSIEVPYTVVTVGTRKEEKLIPDYNNETYNNLLESQRVRDQSETLGNISSIAVINDVPEEEFDFYESIAKATKSNVDANFIKSLWLLDQIEDEEELGDFQEAILGLSEPTQKGIEESEKKFPSSD